MDDLAKFERKIRARKTLDLDIDRTSDAKQRQEQETVESILSL